MSNEKNVKGPRILSRRDFLLAATALAGTGIALANTTSTVTNAESTSAPQAQSGGGKVDTINVALIGAGAQGRVLLDSLIKLPGIKVVAICDIWEYSSRSSSRYIKHYGHDAAVYEDYREMLDKQKDLHAAIIATPDFVHAPQTIACLEAGLDVYCEKEMSNTLEAAKSMVEAQRRTGKLLQIGHQRRSNPRYQHMVNNLFSDANLIGRINHAYAQWNRSKSDDLTWPKRYEIPQATLEKYGYANMHEFRNWRWYKKYGGGPIVDLGSHQIDIFSWVFGSNPISVMAAGGKDYYTNHEWYDNVYAIYEYQTEGGIARALYKVLTTTKHGLFYEAFMGDMGSVDISELPARGNWAWRDEHAPEEEWLSLVDKGWLMAPPADKPNAAEQNVVVDVRATPEAAKWPFPVELAKPAHMPHLENFFDAMRNGTPLNCPAEVGYETAVAVLKVNEAVAAEKKLFFAENDFTVA